MHPTRWFTRVLPTKSGLPTRADVETGAGAVGTILDPKGKAIESIKKDEPFYGEVDILGKPFITGYKPIRDASKNVSGIYYVGYMK
jgi:hypothetical protein